VWDFRTSSLHEAHRRLPDNIRASTTDSTLTIFGVTEHRVEKVGYYTPSGLPGYGDQNSTFPYNSRRFNDFPCSLKSDNPRRERGYLFNGSI
jgi:hypothetical protein